MRRPRLSLYAALALLAACGQKGPLVLPGHKPKAVVAAPAQPQPPAATPGAAPAEQPATPEAKPDPSKDDSTATPRR